MRDFAFTRPSRWFRTAAAATALSAALLTTSTSSAVAELPVPHGPDTAIVILGYGLLPDGGMRPELIERLSAGYVSALVSPASPIIVTGGNPQADVTEARAMADWLTARGIPPERVHLEPDARSTVENAELSAAVMAELGSHDAVLITSSDHMPRAVATFAAAGVRVTDTCTPDDLPYTALFTPMP